MRRQVAVRAERNEVQDQSSLIARYQKEVAGLRAHLGRVGSTGMHDPMHPEVCVQIAAKPGLVSMECVLAGERECSQLPYSAVLCKAAVLRNKLVTSHSTLSARPFMSSAYWVL